MLKSTKNLRKLKPGFCFAINREGFISVETWNDKSPREDALMAKTPRVRMLGIRLGDEKSNSYKDIKAEFSWHEFPRWAFYFDASERKIQVGFEEYTIAFDCFSGDSCIEQMHLISEPIF